MRISDWSSDVCSSDLSKTEIMPDWCADGTRMARLYMRTDDGIKIGRASCRERVCQYRVDLGGRRNIQKKKRLGRGTCGISPHKEQLQQSTHTNTVTYRKSVYSIYT